MNIIDDLEHRFKDLPYVSLCLVRRYSRLDWDQCIEIREELLDRKRRDGILVLEDRKYGRKAKPSKYRQLERI